MKKVVLIALTAFAAVAYASNGRESIQDVRIAPFVQSCWGQKLDTGYENLGDYCFNLYTPSHDPCGCSATAMAQIMRYWQYPVTAPAGNYACAVNLEPMTLEIDTGAYDYANMPLDTREGIPEAQRQAIGKLTYDCAVALHTYFGPTESVAYSDFAFSILTGTFGYANAMGYCPNGIAFSDIRDALFSNFDMGCPVMIGLVTDGDQAHQVLADGYGFDGETPYVHLVCGWPQRSDFCDRWYALPNVEAVDFSFTRIDGIVYNIFPAGTGDILSGRVLDASGNPVANATVTATGNGVSASDTTDANGIYAFLLEGGKTYMVASDGASKTVSLKKSVSAVCSWANPLAPTYSFAGICGNSWGNDLVLGGTPTPTPEPEPDPGEEDPLGAFNPTKAVNGVYPYTGAVYDESGAACGTMTLKIGKASTKGISKISGTIMLLDGKKYSVKSTPFEVNESGPAKGEDIEVKKLGVVNLSVGENGFTASVACLDGSALTAKTADLSQGLADGLATFSVKGLPTIWGGYDVLTNCTADGQLIAVSGKKWDCGKAASLKYAKVYDKDPGTGKKLKTYSWELQGLDDPTKPNLSGLKLAYTPKTASFKGSFYLYTDVGTEAKPKLKKTKVSVTGFVIDGKGVGTATAKGSGGASPVDAIVSIASE